MRAASSSMNRGLPPLRSRSSATSSGVAFEVHLDERAGGVGVERVEVEHGDVVASGRRCPTLFEIGTAVASSMKGSAGARRRSTSSSTTSSPQCRSERTSTRGRSRASASRYACTAHNASPRAGRRRRAHRTGRAGTTARPRCARRVSRSGHVTPRRPSPRPSRVVRGVVEVDPARVPDGFGDRPPHVGLAVREAGALSTVAPRSSYAIAASSTANRLLPTPASPKRSTSWARWRLSAASNMRRSSDIWGRRRRARRGSAPVVAPKRDDLLGGPRFDGLFAPFTTERTSGSQRTTRRWRRR